jgi:hypothetical protein
VPGIVDDDRDLGGGGVVRADGEYIAEPDDLSDAMMDRMASEAPSADGLVLTSPARNAAATSLPARQLP